jgi:hypothetical protein
LVSHPHRARPAFSDYVLREAGGTALDDGRLRAFGAP